MPNLESLEKIIVNKITLGVSLVVLFLLAAANLIGTNALATRGFDVSAVETKTLALEKENHDLQVKIEESTQLKSFEQSAVSSGFIRTHDIVFMPTPPATAMR